MERARLEEEARGAGAADVRRWTGVRNIVESREMLRCLFRLAGDHKAQVAKGGGVLRAGRLRGAPPRLHASSTPRHTTHVPDHPSPPPWVQLADTHAEMAKMAEEQDLLRTQLDAALQLATASRRHATVAQVSHWAGAGLTPQGACCIPPAASACRLPPPPNACPQATAVAAISTPCRGDAGEGTEEGAAPRDGRCAPSSPPSNACHQQAHPAPLCARHTVIAPGAACSARHAPAAPPPPSLLCPLLLHLQG